MKSLLAAASLAVGVGTALLLPNHGAAAVLFCTALALVAVFIFSRSGTDSEFLVQLFVAGLLVRVLVGTAIFTFQLQNFFGGDALTYDELGNGVASIWRGEFNLGLYGSTSEWYRGRDWGMPYVVGAIYMVVGRNMLAIQYLSAVLGAATAPIIYLCAQHIFHNRRVARLSAFFVAFYPSLVLWSSQGLKDGPIVFLLALSMLATLRLGERLSLKQLIVLGVGLFGILNLRFYVFYMVAAAAAGAFLVGRSRATARSMARQVMIVATLGLVLTGLGVTRTATSRLETFGSLEAVQRSRDDLARAGTGFGQDVDVSTTTGAISVIPLGMMYLLFAPFPWQLANLRQSITLPEMLVWWASFPLLVIGIWFTLKYRLRQALPILLFTAMLTLAYSVFQGNVGTAYRQRSQLLVFYFIFASVGIALLRERQEDRERSKGHKRIARAPVVPARPPARPSTTLGAHGPAPATQREASAPHTAGGGGGRVKERWAGAGEA